MSNGYAVSIAWFFWAFERDDRSSAYENMPPPISIRIVRRYISRICSGLHIFVAGKVSIGVRHRSRPFLRSSVAFL